MRDVRSKNGFEKLKEMIRSAYNNPNNDAVISMQTKITSDPKFLMSQIQASYEMVVPQYLEPIIREGIEDGSIKTSYPKELASVLITLLNVWINPMIEQVTVDEMKQKLEFLRILLKGIGLDLIDDDIIQQYTQYCEHYSIQKTSLTT